MCPTLESSYTQPHPAPHPPHSNPIHFRPLQAHRNTTTTPSPCLPPTPYPLPSTLHLSSSLAPQTPFLASACPQPRLPSLPPTHLHKTLAEYTNAPAANHSAHRRNKKEAHILPSYPISIFARAVALKPEERDCMGSHRSGDMYNIAEQSTVGEKMYRKKRAISSIPVEYQELSIYLPYFNSSITLPRSYLILKMCLLIPTPQAYQFLTYSQPQTPVSRSHRHRKKGTRTHTHGSCVPKVPTTYQPPLPSP